MNRGRTARQRFVWMAAHDRWLIWVALAWMLSVSAIAHAAAKEAQPVTIPFQLHGTHIFLDILINGKPATFVLDTGASANIITPETVKRLQLTPGREQTPLTGAAGRAGTVSRVKIALIRLGAKRLADQSAYRISLPEALPCDGLLGTPFLEHQVVTIDYEHGQLTMTPREAFKPSPGAAAFELRFYGNTPFIEATADGHKGWFRIDTGAGNAVSLFGGFIEQYHLRGKYSPSLHLITGRGVGGLLYGDLVRLPEFAIGDFHFPRPITELTRQTEGTFGDRQNAGNLGGEIWRQFTISLDYAGHKVYLAPNSLYGMPFTTPRSGLAVDTENGMNVVREVTANSPGSEAGVVIGDVLLAVDGVPVEQIKPWDLTAILRREPGTRLRLRLRSPDKTERDVTLTLRDML